MKNLLFTIALLIPFLGSAQEINWMTWEEAIEANEEEPRKIFVDVYTEWCGWCKKMDSGTFAEDDVVEYMNENFYAVKLDAETKDTIQFNGYGFTNMNPESSRGTHELAVSLLDGSMSYPSFVFLNEDVERLHVLKGYQQTEQFLAWLTYISEEQYLEEKEEE